MKKAYLHKLNSFAHQLLADHSFDDINKIIVTEAIAITGVENACLIYKDKDEIKNGFTTLTFLQKIVKKTSLEKILSKKNIVTLQKNDLKEAAGDIKKYNVKEIIALPLSNDKAFGKILLFSSKENFLDENISDILKLFCVIATLGLNKNMGKKELEKGLELRDQFISIASHELRTPLTSINGYIQLLRTKLKDSNLAESRWLESLHAESTRLTRLMKELLDINRINQGKFNFIFGEVSMKDVIEKAIERARLTETNRHIIFENKIKDRQHTVIGDFDKLVEMASGIINNAIKFSPPQSKIYVLLNNTPNSVYIFVKDEGRGMTKEELDAIFKGFYKSDLTHIEGMGVGLFLAKHIIANHRGKLKVNSKIKKGTTVEVSLPQARSEAL